MEKKNLVKTLFTCSLVLEATTRPFRRIECQFSMCEPLKKRDRRGSLLNQNSIKFQTGHDIKRKLNFLKNNLLAV